MQTLTASDYAAFDQNAEFSLQNLIHVRRLVEEADVPLRDEDITTGAESRAVRRKAVSKVESPTAYQHFAGNVV